VQVKSASNSPTSSDGDGSGDEGDAAAKANGGPLDGARAQSGLSASTSGVTARNAGAGGPPPPYMETLHFFGVFDGHGGAEAALHCAQTLHKRIAEALSAATTSVGAGEAAPAAPAAAAPHAHGLAGAECSTCPAVGAAVGTEEASLVALQPSGSLSAASVLASVSEDAPGGGSPPAPDPGAAPGAPAASSSAAARAAAVERTHSRGNSDRSQSSGSDALVEAALDEATAAAVDGGDGAPGDGAADAEPGKGDGDSFCSVAKFESALQSAFNRTDEEFGKADNAALVGTTAVVALVGSRHLYVANCGARPCLTVLHTTLVTALTHTLHTVRERGVVQWFHAAFLTPQQWLYLCGGPCAGDSRAVLCRGSVAIPLTDDHKAAREDETVCLVASLPHCWCWVLCWQGRCGDRETCGLCVCLC
jgi:hypothetical protein